MITALIPKLPMRSKAATHDFYINQMGFVRFGGDFPDYLMVEKDGFQIHFFVHGSLDPAENYGQVYIRTSDISALYSSIKEMGIKTTALETKPWGQREFSLLDPDNNLLTFGQGA